MARKKKIKIVIVEDDLYYNKALTKYVETICKGQISRTFDFEIKSYLNGHDCIEQLEDDTGIMILDYHLINENEPDEINGEDVCREVKKYCPNCKIIMISVQQDAHKTAELMRKEIFEYIDKTKNTKNRIGAVLQRAIVSIGA